MFNPVGVVTSLEPEDLNVTLTLIASIGLNTITFLPVMILFKFIVSFSPDGFLTSTFSRVISFPNPSATTSTSTAFTISPLVKENSNPP